MISAIWPPPALRPNDLRDLMSSDLRDLMISDHRDLWICDLVI